ncbi:biotin transporter BioY [Granulosicoccaceae sp. 1_MG-2023]|nr:biotin transporter BioY [Granulosicoccaceae sp. 1_MG-2023]
MQSQDKNLVQIALYAAVIAALGLVPPFSLPLTGGVPITAQTLGVMLAGIMLGPLRGALAVLLLLFVTALGAPLLAGGRGGLGVFAGPSVGFLLGWPVAAFVTGLLMKSLRRLDVLISATIAAFTGCILVLYAIGVPGIVMMTDLDFATAFKGSMAFVPGDLIKVAVAALIARTVQRGMPSAILSRS